MLSRLALAWKIVRGVAEHAQKPGPCGMCTGKDYVLGEFRRLLDEERQARAEERRVFFEALNPGITARMNPQPKPAPAAVPIAEPEGEDIPERSW